MMSQQKNRFKLCSDHELESDIKAHLAFLEGPVEAEKQRLEEHIEAHESFAEQQHLLVSIQGIGPKTAGIVLGEISSVETLQVNQAQPFPLNQRDIFDQNAQRYQNRAFLISLS